MKRGFASPGTLLLLIGILLAVGLAIVALKLARNAELGREIGTTLVYELDSDRIPSTREREMTVSALKRRINTGWWGKARIRLTQDGKIEIGIRGNDADNARRIQDLVERTGTLEFRILANVRDHKELIERAKKDEATVLRAEKKDDNGEYPILAWWVPLQEGKNEADKQRAESALAPPEIATRTVKEGKTEVRQVLVVKDQYDVDGRFLRDVFPDTDRHGTPCVQFRFNDEGGHRFAALTGNNLPERGGAFSRKLAIIIDNRIYSAPSIQSTISDRGEITGAFTKEEVQDLVNVLNAGSLPVAIKLVEKRVDEPKKP